MAFNLEKSQEKVNLAKYFLQGKYTYINFRHQESGFIAAIKKIVKSKVKEYKMI